MRQHTKRPANRGYQTEAFDALRLSFAQKVDLHRGLDQYRSMEYNREQREAARFEYRSTRPVEVRIHHPGGSTMVYLVEPRDLSSSGIGFVHGSFVHPGAGCEIMMKSREGKCVQLFGEVARCRLIKGRMHLVGVAFAEKIELENFYIQSYGDERAKSHAENAGEVVEEFEVTKLFSTRAEDSDVQRLLPDYVQRMMAMVKDVIGALRSERIDLAAQKCDLLQASAIDYGYPPIAQSAGSLSDQLQGGRLGARWKEELFQLGSQIEAAKRALYDA